MQIELEEARKLSRERLENQQLVASFDRWAEMLVPTVPENRVTTLVATPKRRGTGTSGRVLVPKVNRGLTPKADGSLGLLVGPEKEMANFVAAVREGRESAMDDWIDLY